MSKVNKKVKEYLSVPNKVNVLSTSNKAGESNIAMFGSVVLKDDSTLMLVLRENRTYTNLRENPHAALLVIIPGRTGPETEGCRMYIKVSTIEDSGATLEEMKTQIRAKIGDRADTLKYLVIFDILETRPIVDMGQGI